MARIISSPLGELRGKLGGIVFSRNKSGGTVRQHIKPINANSQAQQNTRNVFRSLGSAWRILGASRQQAWEAFAKSIFNPLFKTNSGQYSGVNAMKALNLGIVNSNLKLETPLVTPKPGADDSTVVVAKYVNISDAPDKTVRPDILGATDLSYPLKLDSAVVESDGNIDLNIVFLGAPTAGIGQPQFIDSQNLPYGFDIWFSEPFVGIQDRPKNQFNALVASTGIMTLSVEMLDTASGALIELQPVGALSTFKRGLIVGQYVEVTLVVKASNGTASIAGSSVTVIT